MHDIRCRRAERGAEVVKIFEIGLVDGVADNFNI